MLKFIDEKGTEHLVQAEFKTSNGVNGERSISGQIISNDKVIHALGRGWRLEFENEFYCIDYAYPDDSGKEVVIEFDAVHQFFYDFKKSVIHKELNGSNTFDAYLRFIFDNSGYSYRVETKVDAIEKQSFGFKNRLDLFKDIIKSVGVEFTISGKVVRILDKVGTDLSTIVKKGFNLQELKLEHNIGEFITYKKGYGAYFDEDNKEKGRLTVEYKSPLAEVYGILEGDPVMDERYSIKDNLLTRLKNEVDNSYSISVSLSMEELNAAGYEQERPHAGDYIMAINEDVDFKERVRIVSFNSSYDTDGSLIDHDVTCNSISMANRQSKGDKAWKSEVEANLENAVSTAENAAISANGKNMTFYGLFGPDGKGEPKATKNGDTWYKPVGEETEVFYWDGKSWEPLMSTKDNKIIQEKIEELEKESKENQEKSEKALADAEKARQEAFDSTSIAKQAEKDALNAIAKGEENSVEVYKLDNKLNITNSKVDGNVVDITNIKIENNKLSSTISKVETDLDNLEIGNRNLLTGTSEYVEITGNGKENQAVNLYKMVQNLGELIQFDTKNFTTRLQWIVTDGATGSFLIQVNNVPRWMQSPVTKVDSQNTKGDLIFTSEKQDNWNNSKANHMQVRLDNFNGKIRFKNVKFERGNHATDWSPAPEDMATQVELSNVTQTVKGLQVSVQSKAEQSEVTIMSNQLNSTIKRVDGTESKVTQLSNQLDFKVSANEVISRINMSPERIRIDSKLIHLSGQTLIDDAVIKEAMIADAAITNAKIQDASINSAKIINLDVNKLVGNKTEFVQSNWNGVSKYVSINSEGIILQESASTINSKLTNEGIRLFAQGKEAGSLTYHISKPKTGIAFVTYPGSVMHIGYGRGVNHVYSTSLTLDGDSGELKLSNVSEIRSDLGVDNKRDLSISSSQKLNLTSQNLKITTLDNADFYSNNLSIVVNGEIKTISNELNLATQSRIVFDSYVYGDSNRLKLEISSLSRGDTIVLAATRYGSIVSRLIFWDDGEIEAIRGSGSGKIIN